MTEFNETIESNPETHRDMETIVNKGSNES